MTAEFEIPQNLGDGGSYLDAGVARALRSIVGDLGALNTRVAAVQTALDAFIAQYNLHRAASGVHVEADSANPITAPAATDPTVDILALVNDLHVQYLAHRLNVTTCHGSVDTNAVTATYPATDEAEAVALVNDLAIQYEAHRVDVSGAPAVHGGADAANALSAPPSTDWDSVITLANDIKAEYNLHHVYVVGSCHAGAGDPNTVTAADAGTELAILTTELNGIKTLYNLHTADLGVHPNPGAAEGTANMSDEATCFALANALKATLNIHFANAGAHLDADSVSSVTVAGATGYEDVVPLVVDIRAQYEAHRIISSVHSKADSAHAGTALGTGGAVTIGTTAADGLDKRLGIGV